ncbi:MAG: A24 family peptidase [Puniceicoccales bacterium]|jgi:leader peptidase (prepilin peptidase)/N-methyltransferase|nr:A24 family peptidase [Puniceicoccales bacterium]
MDTLMLNIVYLVIAVIFGYAFGVFECHIFGSFCSRINYRTHKRIGSAHKIALLQGLLFGVLHWLPSPGLLLRATLISLLFLASRIDRMCGIIPDPLTIAGVVLGLLFSALNEESCAMQTLVISVAKSAEGGLLASAILLWIGIVFEFFTKREGIGFGDIKLMGVLGVFLGCSGALHVLFYASCLALVIRCCLRNSLREKVHCMPFAPHLFWGTLMQTFF